MKNIYQVIICIAVFVSIFALYCVGGKEEELTPVNYNSYNAQGVQKTIPEFENLLEEDKSDVVLNDYKKFKYRYEYAINVKGKVDKATFKVPIPSDEEGRQYISNLKILPKPDKIYSVDGNTIAEYDFLNLREGKRVVSIEGFAHLKRYDLNEARKINKNFEPENDIKRYLIAEKGIETNSQYIKEIAAIIGGNSQAEVVENIYNYVKNNIQYTHGTGIPNAVLALKSGRGKCGEFAAAMVALCRAKRIPARIVTGNIARKNETQHTWVEVYFNEYGWVMYDPTMMAMYRTEKVNGVITKRERVFKQDQEYIAAIRNDFTPWYITYTNTRTGYNGDIKLVEKITISEVK